MKNSVFILGFVYILCLIGIASGQNPREKQKQIKEQILGRTYDGNILPSGINGTGPVSVNVSVVVKNILAVDDLNMNIDVQLIMRLEWNDPRLAYTIFPPNSGPDHVTLSPPTIDKVWTPDIYIINALQSDLKSPNRILQIYPTGDVNYSVLVTAKTHCAMALSYYPHDIQDCDVKISSFGYSSSDLKFAWKDTSPVKVASDIMLSSFVLDSITNEICDTSTSTGTYSCVKVGLSLKRECHYYLIQVYIPCLMLVIISWLTYWLHPTKTATGRLILSIAALGLAVIGAGALNTMTPRVSYSKAIDIWTGTTLTFIFLSLVEFVMVNYLSRYGPACPVRGKSVANPVGGNSDLAEQQTPLNPSEEEKGQSQEASIVSGGGNRQGGEKLAEVVDVGFRIGIPVFFLLFVIIYWAVYV